MKIGMVTSCYKPVVNGVTHMVSLYKRELEALGHEVYVFTLGQPDPAGEDTNVIRSPAIPFKDGYYMSLRYSREAQKLMYQMDILHCHHLIMSVELAHRYANCPVIYTNHTRYDLYATSKVSLPQPAADALMRQIWPEFSDFADVVITPSASVRQVMLDFGVRRPIEVIENGIDLVPFRNPIAPKTKTELGIPETAVLAIYIGRLAPEKNLFTLLKQMAAARDIVPNLHLALGGHGELEEALHRYAAELNITDAVHFLGSLHYKEMPNYLSAADFFVTASTTEVHPLTVIEAMACGLPVAAAAAPGIIDTVISGESGFLANDPEAGLAAAIVGLALDEKRRHQMGQCAKVTSERYDIKNTVQRTLALYEKLQGTRPDLSRKKRHGRWLRQEEKWMPILDQLTHILRSDKTGTAPLSLKWFSSLDENGDAGQKIEDLDSRL
ncbi:MAG: glycosyltransferase [Anaerolineae bacterium]|nr:glycosyltransferase [Anaerolineae bacterium]